MIVKVYSWLPRSHVHIAEVLSKIESGISDFEVSDVKYNENLSFIIKSFSNYKNLEFSLDGEGLYCLSAKLPEVNIDSEVREFYEFAKKFIKEEVIKRFHNVTHVQINEGILPINFTTFVLSVKEHPVKGFEHKKSGGFSIYFKQSDFYVRDSFVYLSGKFSVSVFDFINLSAFSNLLSRFMFEMMNKMEEYHHGTKRVIKLLDDNPDSELINNAYIKIDLVKKDASESYAKVVQSLECISRKNKFFIDCSKRNNSLIHALNIDNNFVRINADKEYVLNLWKLLLNHLTSVDASVKSQVNFRSLKSKRSDYFFGLLNTVFVLAALISSVFLVNSGINGFFELSLLLVFWIIFYLISCYFLIKRIS